MAYVITKEKCLGCGACVPACGQNAIQQANGKYQILKNRCTDCGACVNVCPVEAITKE